MDLHIADHAQPLTEMRRLLNVHRAYEYMNRGDVAIEHGDIEAALKEYGNAEKLFPENEEMQYWNAVSLVNAGKFEDALPIFKKVFNKNPDWRELTPRIVNAGLLKCSVRDRARADRGDSRSPAGVASEGCNQP